MTQSSRLPTGVDVFDAGGERIGRLEEVLRDVEDPAVAFGNVVLFRHGRRRHVLVSLVDAAVVPARGVVVRCGARLAREAPRLNRAGRLSVGAEPDLYRHYDLAYRQPAGGQSRLRSA